MPLPSYPPAYPPIQPGRRRRGVPSTDASANVPMATVRLDTSFPFDAAEGRNDANVGELLMEVAWDLGYWDKMKDIHARPKIWKIKTYV